MINKHIAILTLISLSALTSLEGIVNERIAGLVEKLDKVKLSDRRSLEGYLRHYFIPGLSTVKEKKPLSADSQKIASYITKNYEELLKTDKKESATNFAIKAVGHVTLYSKANGAFDKNDAAGKPRAGYSASEKVAKEKSSLYETLAGAGAGILGAGTKVADQMNPNAGTSAAQVGTQRTPAPAARSKAATKTSTTKKARTGKSSAAKASAGRTAAAKKGASTKGIAVSKKAPTKKTPLGRRSESEAAKKKKRDEIRERARS